MGFFLTLPLCDSLLTALSRVVIPFSSLPPSQTVSFRRSPHDITSPLTPLSPPVILFTECGFLTLPLLSPLTLPSPVVILWTWASFSHFLYVPLRSPLYPGSSSF